MGAAKALVSDLQALDAETKKASGSIASLVQLRALEEGIKQKHAMEDPEQLLALGDQWSRAEDEEMHEENKLNEAQAIIEIDTLTDPSMGLFQSMPQA